MCPKCLLRGARPDKASPVDATRAYENLNPQVPIMKPAQVDKLFPELEILDVVGHGGMGVVYKAKQKNLGREVALKLLASNLKDNPAFEERFTREARAMAMMNHPNIISIFDFGQRGGHYYLVMEYVDGLNLRQLIQGTKIEPAEAMQMVPQLCDALQYAHDRGIVHRDIKPENVLISQDGFLKIADFGLAKLTDGAPGNFTLTQSRQVMGTLNYMAPEQVERPTEVDHRADIYSLGVVIYELLTGELPLGRFSPPSAKAEIDVRLDEIVLRALEKDPALRYQQAREFKTGLESVSGGPFVRKFGGTPTDQQLASKIAQFIWFAIALTFCIGGGITIAIGAAIDVEDRIAVPGLVAAGIGALLFALMGVFHSIFEPGQAAPVRAKPPRRKQRFGRFLMIVGVVIGLALLSFLPVVSWTIMADGTAEPAWFTGSIWIVLTILVVLAGIVAMRNVGNSNREGHPQPGLADPTAMPNYLIAGKSLAMLLFFACPVLFLAASSFHMSELRFAGIIAPIAGAGVASIVSMIARNKGYHDVDNDKKKNK